MGGRGWEVIKNAFFMAVIARRYDAAIPNKIHRAVIPTEAEGSLVPVILNLFQDLGGCSGGFIPPGWYFCHPDRSGGIPCSYYPELVSGSPSILAKNERMFKVRVVFHHLRLKWE